MNKIINFKILFLSHVLQEYLAKVHKLALKVPDNNPAMPRMNI